MKWGPVLAVACALAALTLVMLFSAALFPVALGAALAGVGIGLVWGGQAVARDQKVRTLVVSAFDNDSAPTLATALVEVLGTPDVVQARTRHLSREAAMLATRYANGDASDY